MGKLTENLPLEIRLELYNKALDLTAMALANISFQTKLDFFQAVDKGMPALYDELNSNKERGNTPEILEMITEFDTDDWQMVRRLHSEILGKKIIKRWTLNVLTFLVFLSVAIFALLNK